MTERWATVRDAMIWGYSLFALIVFEYILAQPRRLATLLRWYSRFIFDRLPFDAARNAAG